METLIMEECHGLCVVIATTLDHIVTPVVSIRGCPCVCCTRGLSAREMSRTRHLGVIVFGSFTGESEVFVVKST